MKFLRELLAAILGVFIAFGIMFLFFMIIGSSLGSADTIVVKKKSVLEINLNSPVRDDYSVSDPFAELFGETDSDVLEMHEIISAIENAKTDDNIKGISLDAMWVNAGLAQTQAIRDKLIDFKDSGKFITAYADYYTQKGYYLGSVADSVYLNPVGGVDFKGLSSEVLYFKDFEDKYGIKMEVIRHGKYKSAVEPFLSNSMSEENREQISSFLASIWSKMAQDMADSRNMSIDQINAIADDLLARNPKLAVANNMIDGELYKDQYEAILKAAMSVDEDSKLNTISINDYVASGKGRIKSTAKDKIAVVYALGEIMYGEGDENYIGQQAIIKALRRVRKDQSVKAVVLRVNSPGGSALASDLIWRELELTKAEKPLVVSMGNLAASGGYYIACNANKIFAEPSTITGSIGVFGMIPNIEQFAANIGINAEQVGTNKQSVGYSPFEPMSEDFYKVTQEGVEEVYTTFVNRVAKGRGMSFAAVDSIAQGRVWSGKEAVANGLVDELGSLNEAIEAAADLAEISDYRTSNYPRFNRDFDDAFEPFSFMKVKKEELLEEELTDGQFKVYKSLKKLKKLKGIQARMPFEIQIK